VVTGARAPKLASLDDLGGREVHVRPSSSYHGSLVALNARLRSQGKPEAIIVAVPDALEDEDLMDMVAAGLLKLTVVDDWKARLWAGMHKGRLRARSDLALTRARASAGRSAPAVRSSRPWSTNHRPLPRLPCDALSQLPAVPGGAAQRPPPTPIGSVSSAPSRCSASTRRATASTT